MKKTILHHAKIYLEKGKFAEACCIENGVITKVGTDAELLPLAGGAEVIDCGGRTVIPGLNDSHCHLGGIAISYSYVPILGAKSVEDVIERSKKFLAAHPGAKSLRGMGWNVVDFVEGEQRDLTRHDLDRISTEIPISLQRACGHMEVFNTRALEIAKVDEHTAQVEGGYIGHDADGSPNGQFSDNARKLVGDFVPQPSAEEIEQNLDTALHYAASVGLTSMQSNDVGTFVPAEYVYPMLHRYHDAGRLPIRVHEQNAFASLEEMKHYITTERKDPRYDDVLSFGPLKLFKDGSIGGRSALLREDYCDDPGNRGLSVASDEELDAFCALADQNDMQVVCHCIGDGAVESLIGRFEKIMHGGKNTHRNGIIHCQLMDRPMMERIVKDDILALEQPIFLDSDMHALETRISEDLARTSNAYGSFLKLGARQSFGTDSPVEDCNPFPCIYSAVTRCDKHGWPAGGYFPEERIGVEDAIDIYTAGGAYAQFMEKKKGRIREGFYADLVVLDRDIFTCDPMEIRGIRPVLTMMGGNITFKA